MWVTSLVMTVNFTMPIERKLAAIMFTDIAGYTEQMSKDEDRSYLKTAYNQVQVKALEMDDAAKFLSYRIPKAIVEAYKKSKDKE